MEAMVVRQMLSQFFIGRNGFDALNKLLLALALIFWIGSRFASGGLYTLLFYCFLFAAGVCIFRSLSRNLSKRQEENRWFTGLADRFRGRSETFSNRREQYMEYKVFKCPSCGLKMRVPRGEGRIRVTCRQCGAEFEKKT